MDASTAESRLIGDLGVRQPLGVEILDDASAQPGEFRHLLLSEGEPVGDFAQQ